jgi:hypothetical protein
MYYVCVVADSGSAHARIFSTDTLPRDRVNGGGAFDIQILVATESLEVAVAAARDLRARLDDQRRLQRRTSPSFAPPG